MDKHQYRDVMLSVYSSVLPRASATYCSAPVTSGARYLEWLDRTGRTLAEIDEGGAEDRHAHAVGVIGPNRDHARHVIERLRLSRKHVIDPTTVSHVLGWTQPEWLSFWEEVIALFAADLVFVDGWQFSNGCAHEFWFAHSRGLPTFDERGSKISLADARALLREAIRVVRERGPSAARLQKVLSQLDQMAAPESD